MLTQICQYLKNWFNRKPDGNLYPRYEGTFIIEGKVLTNVEMETGQYFRIMGSMFNDGVHSTADELVDETFEGAVWLMGIPPEVITLSGQIAAWMEKYGGVSSPALSPYTSESFNGYTYMKGGAESTGASASWTDVFAAQLSPWRKT